MSEGNLEQESRWLNLVQESLRLNIVQESLWLNVVQESLRLNVAEESWHVVEESWRLQQVGWREIEEYRCKYGDPERWPNGFLKVLRTKKDGFWTYWRDHRECENKYLRQVKIFRYD